MPAIPTRAAVYMRMSKDEQEHSIERQEGQINPYVAAKSYAVVKVYKDEGIAGWKDGDKRPAFTQMLADARKGLFEVILCDDVDRFGRLDIHAYGEAVNPLRRAGVRLETVAQGPIDWEDTLSQLNDAIRMVFKREQSNDTSRRILTRFILMAKQGLWVNGSPPYGYAKDAETGKLIEGDPAQLRVVQWLFKTYAEKDVSLRWLAEELYRRGVRNPANRTNGKGEYRWSAQCICKMLRNKNYLGDLHWNEVSKGEFQEYDGQAVVKRRKKGERRRDEPEVIIVAGSHPALIDRETFELVQAKLTGNQGRSAPRNGADDFLLSGLMVCGHCGSWMVGRRGFGGGRDREKHVYICNGYNRWGKKHCGCHWIEERRVVAVLVRKLQEDFLNPDNLDKLRAELRQQAEQKSRAEPADSRRLKAKIRELEKHIATGNRNMALADPDAIAGIAQTVRAWRQERDRLAGELTALAARRDVAAAEAEITRAEAELWRLREGLEQDDPADVRAVLRELVSKVELWWEHRQAGKMQKARFTRGLIHLRLDQSLNRTESIPVNATSAAAPV